MSKIVSTYFVKEGKNEFYCIYYEDGKEDRYLVKDGKVYGKLPN